LIDTAGIREAIDEIEKIGVNRSISSIKDADIIIAMFDNSSTFSVEDRDILDILDKNRDKNIIVVVNKIDLDRKFDIDRLSDFDYIRISVKDNYSPLIENLKRILDNIASCDELMLVSHRQIRGWSKCKECNIEFKNSTYSMKRLEIFSYHLQRMQLKFLKFKYPKPFKF